MNGVKLSDSDQSYINKKLLSFYTGLNSAKSTDYDSLKLEKDKIVTILPTSKINPATQPPFRDTNSTYEIKDACLKCVGDKTKTIEELKMYIFINYSMQILEDYNSTHPSTAKKPCSGKDLLEAAAAGFIIGEGPWGAVGGLLFVGVFGC